MRLTDLLIFLAVFTTNASVYSQTTRLTLKMEDATIAEVFDAIERQTDFYFFYNRNYFNDQRKVSVNFSNKEIVEVLGELFKGENVEYEILDRNILIKVTNALPDISRNSVLQQHAVSGKVTNTSGEPLPGVTVLVKGTTRGTVTNSRGFYRLTDIPENTTLQFSFVGMITHVVEVGNQSSIDVTMQIDIFGIEEVVAIGYAKIKKSHLTGAVSSFDSGSLKVKGTTSIMEALQGQAAGVNIAASDGRAGADFTIKIRGDNSLKGGDPLYVVDGIITDNIQFLNPQDIERLDVLKDASSTAIYGSRGSNGVIIVTTRQAVNVKVEEAVISYEGYYGIRKPSHLPVLMDGDQFWEYRQNAYLGAEFNSGNDITLPQYDQAWLDARTSYASSEVLQNNLVTKNYTDWMDLIVDDGSQQNHYVSISGKSANNMSYLFGLGYQKEDGAFYNEWNERYNSKSSINHKISEKLSVGTNVNIAITEKELGGAWDVRDAFLMPPVVAPYVPNGHEGAGDLNLRPAQSYGMRISALINPLISQKESRSNDRQLYVLGNIYLQYSPLAYLTFKSTFSANINSSRHGIYEGSKSETRDLLDPAAELTKNESVAYTWDNQAVFIKSFDDHGFSFMLLNSINYFNNERSFIAVENLPFESLWHNVGSAPKIIEVGSGFRKTTLASILGRLNYSFKDKYLLTASFRSDGSSKLSQRHKWSTFPSVALAWRISKEGFLHGAENISNLKLRISYGYTGNNNISPYSTLTYVSEQQYYEFGGTIANGFAPANMANSSLTWEKTRELNLGIDFGFLGNRINGSIDVYDKLSDELLLPRKLPVETGWDFVTANIGSVSNKGVELVLNTVNINSKNFSWKLSFTWSKNINKIEKLYGSAQDDIGNLWFIGEPVNVNYTYVFNGIWKADEAEMAAIYGQREGQARVKDLDENNTIEADKDRTVIGTPDPRWTGGFTTTLRYKNFDLNASLYTHRGVQVYSDFHSFYTKMRDRYRNKLDVNYYMPANNVTGFRNSDAYPTPRAEGVYWNEVGYYKDASFVKVKNISLGYTFSPPIVSDLNIRYLRIYVNVLNPFVLTAYDGYDPEWAGSRFGGSIGTTTYQLGLNVRF